MVTAIVIASRETLGSMLIGTGISFILHGILCCQVLWFFRFQSGLASKRMKALVWFIWIGETLNCSFTFLATLNNFLNPAITRARLYSDPCRHWTGPSQGMTSAICTFSVEGFFIMRMWTFSGKKKLLVLAFIPYLIGQSFGFAQVVRSFHVRCNLAASDLNPTFIFGTYSCRLIGDGVVVATMCYMLHVRSSGLTRHTNTIRIVRRLILWTISTGMLTWLATVLWLIAYLCTLPFGLGLYYIRSGLYTTAMFAQLNGRTQMRAMAEASIPLSSLNLGTMSSSQPSQSNHESSHSNSIANHSQKVQPIAE